MQRTRRSFINVATSVLTNLMILVTASIVQKTLVTSLGDDYNGINGLFGNIVTMMSLADLGIGTAIIYHMYRPVAEDDYDRINSLLRFYRKCYIGIAGIILVIGLVMALFIPALVGDIQIHESIYLIFALYLVDCLCSYSFVYKKTLLYANQMNYIPDTIYFVIYMVQNATQIYVLVAYQNFIAFLVVKSLSKCISNLLISLYISWKYPYTRAKKVAPVEPEIKKDIVTKVKGLLCHKLGKLIVTGCDSIVLTGVMGIKAMNLYANYRLIIRGVMALLNRIFDTLTNSVGNFLLDSTQEGRRDIYQKIEFFNFWCFGCVSVGMYAVLQPLVTVWMGESFLFGKEVLFVLVINFYMEGMRASINTFKEAAGIFHEDRRIPLIEAIVNFGVSIVLAKWLGTAGVFLGTIVSTGVVYLYSYPKYVCKPLFGIGYGSYIWKTFKRLILLLFILALVEVCTNPLKTWDPRLRLLAAGSMAVIIFHIVFLSLYGSSREFRFYQNYALQRLFPKRGEKRTKDTTTDE